MLVINTNCIEMHGQQNIKKYFSLFGLGYISFLVNNLRLF